LILCEGVCAEPLRTRSLNIRRVEWQKFITLIHRRSAIFKLISVRVELLLCSGRHVVGTESGIEVVDFDSSPSDVDEFERLSNKSFDS
jgi:hypothetical protein